MEDNVSTEDSGPSSKRPRAAESNSNGSGSKTSSSAGSGSSNPVKLTIEPFSFKSSNLQRFTQRFKFTLPNVNFVQQVRNNIRYVQLPYFSFPMDLRPWYFNPAEYVALRKNHRIAEIKSCEARFKYKNYRPYFVTGATSALIASNQNVPLLEVYKGFKNIQPYLNFVNDGNATDNVGEYLGNNTGLFSNLIRRLYGGEKTNSDGVSEIGAVDGVRGYAIRPTAYHSVTADSTNLCKWQSGYNLAKHRMGCVNSQQIDATWDWKYQPKNGLIHAGPSATGGFNPVEFRGSVVNQSAGLAAQQSVVRIYRTPLDDTSNPTASTVQDDTILNATGELEESIDGFNTSYASSVENIGWHRQGLDKHLDTPPDMFFGMSPQQNIDGSLMLGLTEIEVETECIVYHEDGVPLAYYVPQTSTDAEVSNFNNLNTHMTYDDRAIVGRELAKVDSGYGSGGQAVFRNQQSYQ